MSDIVTTKDRLLIAACAVFSEKGFRDATIAEICDRAAANIAAVNYHFGDKESLYDKVWRHAFSVTIAAYPLDGNLAENPTVEDYLYSYANALLHRIFSEDEGGLFAKLLYHEMASPTLALDKIAKEALFPQITRLSTVIGDAIGTDFDEQALTLCERSIIGQCAFYNFSRPLREHIIGRKTLSQEEIEQIARHIARFSIGGLTAIQQKAAE
jgi:AcrR family transcriptional regulator